MKRINKIQLKNSIAAITILFFLMAVGLSSCQKDMEGKIYQLSDQKMMDEILESKGDTLSSFLKIIDLSGLRGTIHAYGTYTLFAPTNEAVDKYLTDNGLSLNSLTESVAAQIVKYHLIADTIKTSEFVDGRLPATNFNRRYITTKTVSDAAGVSIEVNRQGKIIQKDLRAANGFVHIVNSVLSQSKKSIKDAINGLPASYSFFKEVYSASGIQTMIDEAVKTNPDIVFTCFIQDNDAFASAGISNMDELKAELRVKNPDIKDDALLLYNYMAYHMTSGFTYVVDLMNKSALNTLVPGEVIVLKKDVNRVLLNEFLIGGVLEKGILVDRTSEFTDLSCSNGVIHDINGNIQIVKRRAFRVYWDITEQPELMAMKNFRKPGTSIYLDNTDCAGITWAKTFASDKIQYYCQGYPTTITKDNNYVYGDYFYFRLSTNTMKWIEFKTPVLVPGTYKVWFSYRGLTTVQQIRNIFKQDGQEDQVLGVISTSYNKSPGTYGLTDYNNEFFQKQLLEGYRYQMINSQRFWSNSNNCQALGIIQVFTTGQHTLRMEPLNSSQFSTWWDQILFIPVDEDQIWPKQDNVGEMIYQDTPLCEIYPYSDCSVVPPTE